MTKDELIRALEAATGPSRELDVEIERLLGGLPKVTGPKDPWGWHVERGQAGEFWRGEGADGREIKRFSVKRYTASIDAALTLVPEGCEWSRHRGANGRMTMQVDGLGVVGQHGQAATPAIALAIAALRARP